MKAKDEIALLQRKLASGELDPEEPLFTLRGQDKLAPTVIIVWVELLDLMKHGGSDKGVEALDLAEEMKLWPHRKIPD